MRNPLAALTADERAALRKHLRTPVLTFLALTALLAVNVTLGATLPFAHAWALELLVAAAMALVVLLVSMEVRHEPPMVKLFSGLGFFWVAIMVGMTLTDYLGR
ncbi:oxidase [uncultured Methylobacterium sp.]|uniref:oxidase n=1 Tax=uncultured Methylobacterium sp. TaxID=157278 RepID=UPI0035C95B67